MGCLAAAAAAPAGLAVPLPAVPLGPCTAPGAPGWDGATTPVAAAPSLRGSMRSGSAPLPWSSVLREHRAACQWLLLKQRLRDGGAVLPTGHVDGVGEARPTMRNKIQNVRPAPRWIMLENSVYAGMQVYIHIQYPTFIR
eukprot:SAG11_NODE_4821_length_1754_cov_1.427795_4_plen_139_part_01